MGNCVQSSVGGGSLHGAGGGRLGQMQRRRSEEVEMMEEDQEAAAPAPAPSVVKVKMVLTKGELGWLVARLKQAGDRRLEDVLHEMVARKKRDGGWRPSLESIVECPAETTAASSEHS